MTETAHAARAERMPAATTRRPLALRLGAGLALAVAAFALGVQPASAHVHVDGDDATQGGYGVLTFRVPTESDTASTVGLTVTFPTDAPIANVSYQAVPGWTVSVQTAKLAKPITTDDGSVDTSVQSVTWKADSTATGIAPGQFQLFRLSAGPLPKVAELVLPATQRYSDGTVVNWNERQTGSAEPEHPAPTLTLAAADAASSTAAPSASGEAAMATHMHASDATALGVGIAGIVAGVVGIVIALVAVARTRRRTT